MNLLDIFNNFRDTIFMKSDSNLEKEILELKKIRNETNKDKVDHEIKLLELGLYGEKQIEFELKNANIGMYVLHDITFEFNGNKAQIDYIIITKAYTYLVECKNLIGNIYVSETGEFRREYTINDKKYKEAIYSPYTQAVRHKDLYAKLWKSENESLLDKTIRRNAVSTWYKPLVVLANSKGILNITCAPKEIKNKTIRVDNLINYIKQDISKVNNENYFNKKQMEAIAKRWLDRNIDGSRYIFLKYQSSEASSTSENNSTFDNKKIAQLNDLENELKKFRKTKSKLMNIPAYYIFNNTELEKLLDAKPLNIESLKKILPDVKVNLHGNEIVSIIDKYQ